MKKLDKRLFRMIKATRGQYAAVLMIVITGIFVFTAVNNSATNLRETLDSYYSDTNFADIFVSCANVPEKLEDTIINEANIKEAEGRLVFDTRFITDDEDEKVTVRVVSVNEKENKINKLFMKSGKRELKEKEIIIIDQFASARNINPGDEASLLVNGRKYAFKVAGIASSPEYVYIMENEQSFLPDTMNFGVVFVNEDYLRKLSGTNGSFNEILLKVDNMEDISGTSKFLKDYLDKYGVKRIIEKKEQLSNSMMDEEIKGLEKVSQSIPIVFLLFAGIMMSSMLSRIVKKDRASIGVLKALGFMDWEIVLHYLKYAASVGIIGGILGSLIGTALSGMMTSMYLDYFNIPMLTVRVFYDRIAVSVALSMLFCIASGLWGVRRIIKINPAESMMPEAPKKGKRIMLERIKFIWSRLPFSWKMVVRSIFREKKKFLFIGAAVSITLSMMIMTFWMNDLMDAMFNKHYGEFMKIEYNIGFKGFQDRSIVNDISREIGFKDIEGRIEMPFEIENGRASKVVNIIGLDKNTVFYEFKDIEGKKVTLPESGILLSSNLAKALNVVEGDSVLIKNFIPQRDDGYITVKGVINQSLGINGYMNIDFLNKNFLDRNIVNGVYVNSHDNISGKLNDMNKISTIQSQKEMKGVFEQFTGLITATIGFMIIFSGILGFVIMYSMTLMSINERTMEFSSLRVMGFANSEIFYMVVRENMLMSLLGIACGIPLGIELIKYMGKSFSTDIYTMNEPVTAQGILLSIVATIVFLILAQLMTYAKINRLDFIDSLKSRIS